MDETIRAIGDIIRFRYTSIISVKKIRDFHNIKAKNNSTINFYWRCLQALEQSGILKRYGSNKPKRYQVLNYFKFFELLHDAYISRAMITKNL
ncbi:MAG: hypothetical protein ACFE8B_00650 [Candidatus Hermodarchaeota archaeon]